MIRFDLYCEHGHEFDGWFDSNDAFVSQREAGHVSCPFCDSTVIEKQLMAPRVRTSRAKERKEAKLVSPGRDGKMAELAEQVRALRKEVADNAEYVGDDFANEARRIHNEEAPARGIYGEATADEARSLIEDEVSVMPLPLLPEEMN